MNVTQEQRQWARIAGIALLAKYVLELSGDYVTLIARGGETYAETARYVAAHPFLWRAALLNVQLAWIASAIVAYALYVVLEPVDKRFAQFAFVLRFGSSVVGAASLMFRVAGARLSLAAATPDLFTIEQMTLLDSVIRRGSGSGVVISWVLQGAGTVIFYLLLLRSGHFPRLLARVGMVGSALLVPASLVMIVNPAWTNQLKLVGVPGLLADLVAAVWLISKGFPPRARGGATA